MWHPSKGHIHIPISDWLIITLAMSCTLSELRRCKGRKPNAFRTHSCLIIQSFVNISMNLLSPETGQDFCCKFLSVPIFMFARLCELWNLTEVAKMPTKTRYVGSSQAFQGYSRSSNYHQYKWHNMPFALVIGSRILMVIVTSAVWELRWVNEWVCKV